MDIYPAVDIRNGRCVRLMQGDFAREEVFSDDPLAVAEAWFDEGAPLIHVVDLDGAREGGRANAAVVEAMAGRGIPVQVGGGIRSYEDVRSLLDSGARRVVIGTVAVEDPCLRRRLLGEFGERVVVGLDCRDGRVSTRGWLRQEQLRARDLANTVMEEGGRHVLVTDISRDGTLQGPNVELLGEVLETGAAVIASGGVGSVEHLRILARLAAGNPDLKGVIVGRALYVGTLEYELASEIVREELQCWRNE